MLKETEKEETRFFCQVCVIGGISIAGPLGLQLGAPGPSGRQLGAPGSPGC